MDAKTLLYLIETKQKFYIFKTYLWQPCDGVPGPTISFLRYKSLTFDAFLENPLALL